jgi:hypothetical protein
LKGGDIVKQGRSKPPEPPPRTPEEYTNAIWRRLVRIDSRLVRVMQQLGLDEQGNPKPPEDKRQST